MQATESRAEDTQGRHRARREALRIAVTYGVLAAIWIAVSDRVELALDVARRLDGWANTGKGLFFVLVTAVLLYGLVFRSLAHLYENQRRYREAQDELRKRDKSILQAYIDVIDAVTGGKLILMWPDQLEAALGEVVLPATPITDPSQLSDARHLITTAIEGKTDDVDDACLGVSEGLTNALKHGVLGEYEVRETADRLQVIVCDHGPGIDFSNLPKATLVPGFSTKPSLGMGFTIMLDVSDRLLLSTQSGLTKLVLEFAKDSRYADKSPPPREEPARDPEAAWV